jgi:GT2 family glycosyltransferase
LRTAVVILNWNGVQHLKEYLPALVEHTDLQRCQLHVADNGSTDVSVNFVKEHYPQINLILLDKNYGFAEGYNRALAQVDADVFCLLNSDVRVTKGWTDAPLSVLEKHSDVVAVQPKILSDRDRSRFEHAGAAGGFIDKYGYPFCRGRIMDNIEYDNGQHNQRGDIFWASGACMFIRAAVFKAAGGFDGDYFAHMEEIDLCWRLKNQGYRVMYCPKSTVYHYGGATLEYNNPRKLYLNFRNSLWTLYKNYAGMNLHLTLFLRMCIDTAAIAKFICSFDWKNALAVVKAHMAFYRARKVLKEKRAALMAKAIRTTHPEMLEGSIVFRFFVHNTKTFSNLKRFRTGINLE